MKRLALLLLVAAAPPANVTMQNGQPRAITPISVIDGAGNMLGTADNPLYVQGNTGGGGGTYTGPAANQLPASLGAKTGAQSLSIVPATDAVFNLGTLGGAATSAKQDSIITTLGSPFQAGGLIGNTGFVSTGNVAAGTTDSGNGVKASCVYNSTAPTYTTGQRADVQCDPKGSVFVIPAINATLTDAAANNGSQIAVGNNAFRSLMVNPSYFNGTTWDRVRGDTTGAYTVNTPTASVNNAIQPINTGSGSANLLKSSAGNLYSVNAINGTTAGFLIVYDAAATPAASAALTQTLIRYSFPMAVSAGIDKTFSIPAAFTSGIDVLCSSSLTTYTAITCSLIAGQAK